MSRTIASLLSVVSVSAMILLLRYRSPIKRSLVVIIAELCCCRKRAARKPQARRSRYSTAPKSNGGCLRDDSLDRLAAMRDGTWAAGEIGDSQVRVDAEQLVDCGDEVRGR